MAKPPRVIDTYVNQETCTPWVTITTIGSPSRPWIAVEVPEEATDAILELIDVTHAQLQAAVNLAASGDPSWRGHTDRVISALAKMEHRARGRPQDTARNFHILKLADDHRHASGRPNITQIAKRSGATRKHVHTLLTKYRLLQPNAVAGVDTN